MDCGYDYYKVYNIEEAIDLYKELNNKSIKTKFLAGGSEIATFYKYENTNLSAVIDIKGIENTKGILNKDTKTYFGANTTLSYIQDNSDFGVLNKIIRTLADRTSRNTITLGGNINSKIVFRETVLPFLLSDANVYIGSNNNIIKESLMKIFYKQLNIHPDEILLGIEIDNNYKKYPYQTYKKFKIGKKGYPIVTCASMKCNDGIRIGLSGVASYPFRNTQLELILNDKTKDIKDRVNSSMSLLEPIIIDDQLASKGYRSFLVSNILEEILMKWGQEND